MVYYVGDYRQRKVRRRKVRRHDHGPNHQNHPERLAAEFGNPDGVIRIHKEAELLVVNGTDEELRSSIKPSRPSRRKWRRRRPKTEADKDIDEINNPIKSLETLGSDSK